LYLNQLHRKYCIIFYSACFLLSYCWLAFNGLLLQQLSPVFFINRLDFSLNLLFVTGIQNAVINNYWLQFLLDGIYLLATLLLVFTTLINSRFRYAAALFSLVVNFMYALLISSLTALSIEGFVCWILLPVIFIFKSETAFYYGLQAMRYIFLLIFFSAGLWKIRAGGIFNVEQMSAILLLQHSSYVTADPGNWFSKFIIYLVNNTWLSYGIYLLATLAEIAFIIGFFTKKADKFLILTFVLFAVFDLFLMRINYFSWLSFLFCLWYAKYALPNEDNIATVENA
jgi:hypothetical protein